MNPPFHAEQVNLITYGSLLHGLAGARRWAYAMRLLHLLRQDGISPSETGFSSVLNSCVGQWPQALQLLRPSASVFEVNGVITACEKGGVWELALRILFAASSQFKVAPDMISYSSAISACANRGLWETALLLLFEMTCKRIPANDISFNAVIGACKEDGRWAEALSLLSLMEDQQHPPDVVSFGSAISTCDVAGRWAAAFGLLTSMAQREVTPNVLCFSAALLSLRGLRSAGRAWRMATELVQRMDMARVAMDVPGFDAVAHACDAAAQFSEQPQLLHACEESRGDTNNGGQKTSNMGSRGFTFVSFLCERLNRLLAPCALTLVWLWLAAGTEIGADEVSCLQSGRPLEAAEAPRQTEVVREWASVRGRWLQTFLHWYHAGDSQDE
eukprot:s3225_g10.t1